MNKNEFIKFKREIKETFDQFHGGNMTVGQYEEIKTLMKHIEKNVLFPGTVIDRQKKKDK